MQNNRINRQHSILLGAVLLTALSCTMRGDESITRDNPFDAGGSNWTIDAPPEITLFVRPLWADFNHADSTGSRQITVTVNDRNFPFDTVTAHAVINGQRILLLQTAAPVETTLQVDNLHCSKLYPGDMGASDKRGMLSEAACTVATSSDLPPLPPRPTFSANPGYISFTWQPVPGATSYSVLSANGKHEPFTLMRTLPQPESGPVVVLDTPQYAPRYYRFASINSAGASFLRDTLPGRVYYSGLTPPYFSGISKGSYTACISLSFSISNYSSISHVEIYRSIRDTTSFELIDTLPIAASSYSTSYYYDSISTGDTCYYRMSVVDKYGRCSSPGATGFGYLQRVAPPTSMTLTAYSEYLRLTWSPPSSSAAASYYRIYRSDRSCLENMTPIDSVYTANFQDTTPDARVYYYSVRGVDINGREGAPGTCMSGRITVLPAPLNFKASDRMYLHRIALSWSAVDGASGYIIKRGPGTDTAGQIAIDTVTSTAYDDSVMTTGYLYYRIAAFNARGTGLYSTSAGGRLVAPPGLSATNYSGFVRLTWAAQTGAIKYHIFRSADSTNFYPLDSTNASYYDDPLPDYSRYYYRMAISAPDGKSAPGGAVGGQRLPPAPVGLKAGNVSNAIGLTWGSVPGATHYRLYRSTTSSAFVLYKTLTDTTYSEPATSGQQYYFYVTAVVSGIESSSSASVTAFVATPPMPVNMSVGGYDYHIRIGWYMYQSEVPVDGFYVYRGTSPGGPFFCIDTVSGMEYYDTIPDTLIYYYKVAAFNDRGTGPMTAAYPGRRSIQPSTPAAPIAVRVAGKTDYIEISWNMSPASAPVNGYDIYRSSSASGTFIRIYTVQTLVFCDSVYDTSVYYYKLDAFNTNGVSPATAVYSGRCASLSHAPAAPLGLTASQGSHAGGVALAWSASGDATGYRVYRAPTDTFDRNIILCKDVSATSYLDPVGSDSLYYYKIKAYNTGGEGRFCDTLAAGFRTPSTPPNPPVGIYLSPQPGEIYVGWDRPSTAIGFSGYAIYRSTAADGPFVNIAVKTTIGCFDVPPAVSTRYWYYVTTINPTGASVPSDTVSAMWN